MENDSRLTIKVPTELHEQLAEHVARHDLNLSAVVRRLLTDWLAQQRKERT